MKCNPIKLLFCVKSINFANFLKFCVKQGVTGAPVGHYVWGVATRVTMRVVGNTPLTVTPSLASEPEPPPLLGTLTATLLWSGTSVMWLTRLSAQWKGSDSSSIGWMTLHMSKQRRKPPLTHRPAWCMTFSVTSGLTMMLKPCKDLSFGEVPGVTSRNSHFGVWTIFPTRNLKFPKRIHLF
jgi:hypothetical protein